MKRWRLVLGVAAFASAACSSSESATGSGGAGGQSTSSTPTSTSTSTSTATNTGAGGMSASSSGSATGGAATGGSSTGSGGVAPTCPPAPTGAVPPLKVTQIASGLNKPLYVGASPGDTSRLYIIEQPGLIRLVKNGTLQPDPFLDVQSLVSCCGEQGLLGLAFHPGYAQNGRFWINYTDTNGDTNVVEYKRSASNPDAADPTPVKTLFTVMQPFANHNGGNILFGPDGYLYVGMGDGGSGGDPNGNGQNINTKLGKMLRVDVDNYPTPPPGNLAGGDPQVWDYGLRNPWRWSFDRCTGDLYIGDVGQNLYEEVDVEPKGQGQQNYGWNITEGTHCYNATTCDMTGITMPVLDYPHDGSSLAVTGGFVYRGTAIPNLVGTYLYGDYGSGRVWTFVYQNGTATNKGELTNDLFPNGPGNVSSFGEDAAGELYIVDYGGTVYRIDPE